MPERRTHNLSGPDHQTTANKLLHQSQTYTDARLDCQSRGPQPSSKEEELACLKEEAIANNIRQLLLR